MQRHGEIEVKHGNQSQIDKGSIYKSLQQRYNFNDYRYIKDVVRLVIDNDLNKSSLEVYDQKN